MKLVPKVSVAQNQSNAQEDKSKNLVACPFPVGRSADLGGAVGEDGPTFACPTSHVLYFQSKMGVVEGENPNIQNFFNCFSNNNLILILSEVEGQISHQKRNPLQYWS